MQNKRKPQRTPRGQIAVPSDLYRQLCEFAAAQSPRVSIVALAEAAFREYLQRHTTAAA